MPPLKSTAVRSEHPATLPYPLGKCPSQRLHVSLASWSELTPVTFPVLAGTTAQTPRNATLPVFNISISSPLPRAHLQGQMSTSRLQLRTTGGTSPSSPTTPLHAPRLPAPPPAPQSSGCARPGGAFLTFEGLGVAPRRPARVSSGQRGDTGEVVTHGIRPQGVRRSRGAGEAGQERRYCVRMCARAGARRRGRALPGLRPGAGGPPLSSLSRGRAVLGGSCPPRGSSREPATCLPFPAAGAGAAGEPLGRGRRRRPGLPRSSGWRSGSRCWWAARRLRRAPPGP